MATQRFSSWLTDAAAVARLAFKRLVVPRLGGGSHFGAASYKEATARAVERLHPRRMTLQLKEIVNETPSTKTFRLTRSDGPQPFFRPGQYVNLFVDIAGVKTSRPYSLSTAPHDDTLDLTVRQRAGGFIAPYLLDNARVGQTWTTTGPKGHFYHEPLCDLDKVLFIAGGSGITPFRSMLRDQERQGWPLDVRLVYGSRTPDDVIFAGELERLAAGSGGRFSFVNVLSEPPAGFAGATGLIDAACLAAQAPDAAERTCFVCGPTALYALVLPALQARGVPPYRIRRELYGPPADVTREPGWPAKLGADHEVAVTVEDGPRFAARAGEPLLNALEREGLALPATCRSGACSDCRVRLVSGRVFMPAHAGVRESDRQHGYIHSCVAYPLEDVTIRL